MGLSVYEQRNIYKTREAETRRITPSRSAIAAREGIGVFRRSLKARGLRLVVRSAGGPTFWIKSSTPRPSLLSPTFFPLATIKPTRKTSQIWTKLFNTIAKPSIPTPKTVPIPFYAVALLLPYTSGVRTLKEKWKGRH